MGTQFISQVTKEVAAVLKIEFNLATTKHAQRIGLLERTHASVKAHSKAATDKPAYSQSLPTPKNLKGDITVELAFFIVMESLPPYLLLNTQVLFLPRENEMDIFASWWICANQQPHHTRLPNYVNNNHPVSTLSDAAQH